MSTNICTPCLKRLEEHFSPSAPTSTSSLSLYTHQPDTCSLREFIEKADDHTSPSETETDTLPLSKATSVLVFDQWDYNKLPGILLVDARLQAGGSAALDFQSMVLLEDRKKPEVLDKLAFCQAGSIWTDSPVWHRHPVSSVQKLLPTISRWLRECYISPDHLTCHDKPPRVSYQLPTRVIDVGPSDGSQPPHLLETNGTYGSYVVLSHCWGHYQPFVTNSETFERNLKYISLLSLPKTFRDAIYITRGLGIRYLWIDSVCIIQGDASDWETESADMIRIFQNATLALAATAATDSREGCCFRRQPSSLDISINKYPNGSTIHARKVPNESTLRKSILEAPLNQRAWVLQELLLSSRVVHFAKDQMYWQCSSRLVSEDGLLDQKTVNDTSNAENENRGPGNSWLQSKIFGLVGNLTSKIDWWDSDVSRDFWWTIVEEYSRRSLTHRSDRLSALAGLTEFFQIRTGDIPLAGLWKEDLLFGLLWHVREPVRTPPSSDIPSWSWASLEGSIQRCPVRKAILPSGATFENKRYVGYRANIKDSNVEWAGVPLVSLILKGELVLSGRSTFGHSLDRVYDEAFNAISDTSTSRLADEMMAAWYYSDSKEPQNLYADKACCLLIGVVSFDCQSSASPPLGFECLEISFSSPFEDSSSGRLASGAAFHEILLLECISGSMTYRRVGAGIIFVDVLAFETESIRTFHIV